MDRQNSLGRDYSQAADRERHAIALQKVDSETLTAGPIIGGKLKAGTNPQPVTNPFDTTRVLGHVSEATEADIDAAVDAAARAQIAWDRKGGAARGVVLRTMADALEANMDRLVALLSREAGKTLNDGVAEIREAADFCRYYAMLAERDFGGPTELKGPVGEINQLVLHGRGVFACISPWNFPLAIFTGQIAAALAAGNAVLCIGEQVFACRIQTRAADITSDDYRFDTPNLEHTAIECPALISRIHGYMQAFGLNFGCFDFIITKSGEAVFLECNCNGQWYWVEQRTGQPIGEAIATELLRHAATRGGKSASVGAI